MAGFTPYRTISGKTGGEVRDFIIDNSKTITLGDAVDVTAGYADLTGATGRSMGVVVGLVRDIGGDQRVPLDQDAAGTVGGTRSGNAGVIGSETYVSASDNTTVDKVLARVIVDPNMEYYNDADGSLAQADIGTYHDLVAASDQIDQDTGSTGQEGDNTNGWILLEIDPHNDGDASKGIFKNVKSQLSM